ncbi:MAG: ABC transporter permease [Deltaproteobacteria bacterium]|nr:ABC transporter permease [Deltaproteobacteria bacterium]
MQMTLRMLGWMFRPPYRLRLLLQAMAFIGVGSLFIITLTALTSGMVLALQGVYSMRMFNATGAVGGAVALSLTREISPVFTALMVTARASSAIATELGTMRVTDQIDALATMGVNPVQYLVVPRVLAGALMTPVLCLLFTFIGMLGCYLVAVVWMGVDPGQFMDKVSRWVGPADFRQSLIKAAVFGTLTILIACQQGYAAKGGAAGVGQATTRAVVIGSVVIMVCDYFLTAAML